MDRSKNVGSGPARFTRYEAWMAIGPRSRAVRASRKAAWSPGGAARRRQVVGLSEKIWSVPAPIAWARSTALTMPSARGR